MHIDVDRSYRFWTYLNIKTKLKHFRAPIRTSTLFSAKRRCNVPAGRFHRYKYYQRRSFVQTSASYNTANMWNSCLASCSWQALHRFRQTDFHLLNFSMHFIHNCLRIREIKSEACKMSTCITKLTQYDGSRGLLVTFVASFRLAFCKVRLTKIPST